MDKDAIIRSLQSSFKMLMEKDSHKRINRAEAERIINHAIDHINYSKTNYNQAILIAEDVFADITKLKRK